MRSWTFLYEIQSEQLLLEAFFGLMRIFGISIFYVMFVLAHI